MTSPDTVRFLNPPTLPPSPGYTQVVAVTNARTVYVAGQVALDPSGALVGPGDFRVQAQQVFANLQAALEAAGATFADVIKLTLYLTDMAFSPCLARCATAMSTPNSRPPAPPSRSRVSPAKSSF